LRKNVLVTALTLLLSLGLALAPMIGSGSPYLIATAAGAPAPADNAPATTFAYPVGAPDVAPTFDAGNANGYQITQMFNNSCDPSQGQGYYYAGQYFCGHTGVDLSDGATGGTVRAVANGVVVVAGDNSSYGEMVRIRHALPDGSIVYSQYEHMLAGSLTVAPGQAVTIGQAIGLVGATGFVLGPHLHLEIKTVDENGPGYTFGNAALIVGYDDPITFIAARLMAGAAVPAMTTTAPADTAGTASPTDTAGTASPTDTAGTASPDAPTPATTLAPTDTPTPTDIAAPPPPAPPGEPGAPGAPGPPSPRRMAAARDGGEQRGVLDRFYRRYPNYVIVTTEGGATLNVRAGSGFEYPALNAVREGARLGYLGLTGNGWVHVALPGDVTGYVARQWVQGATLPQLPTVITSAAFTPPFIVVLDTRYPARSGPALHDAPLEPLRVGERLAYVGTGATSPSWDEVVLPSGHIGWVLNWYMSKPAVPRVVTSGPVPVDAATPTSASGQASTTGAPPGAYVVAMVDGLNLRSGPRLAAPVIEKLALGAKLLVRGYHVSWAAVTTVDGTEATCRVA